MTELAIKLYLLLTGLFAYLIFILNVISLIETSSSAPFPLYTFWAILSLVFVYVGLYSILFYGLWIGNRLAYAITWVIEVMPLFVGYRYYQSSILFHIFPESFLIGETLFEWLFLALSWKHFFRRGY